MRTTRQLFSSLRRETRPKTVESSRLEDRLSMSSKQTMKFFSKSSETYCTAFAKLENFGNNLPNAQVDLATLIALLSSLEFSPTAFSRINLLISVILLAPKIET